MQIKNQTAVYTNHIHTNEIIMDELDDLSTYDGDVIHDMYVDDDYEINTGELDYVDNDPDECSDNTDGWD